MRKRVSITGATGKIGTKLTRHLEAEGKYDLRLMCLNEAGFPNVLIADLRCYDAAWVEAFKDVDVVVHLANKPMLPIAWSFSAPDNIDITLNVYNAALKHNVRHVVLASSVWVNYGHRFRSPIPSPLLPPDPGISVYGATKIFAERIGKSFFESHGISTIALRIGACLEGEGIPGPHMPTGHWTQDCWVSNRDLCSGLEKAINSEDRNFKIVNLTSLNAARRWSLEEAYDVLGYWPLDAHTTSLKSGKRIQTLVAKLFYHFIPGFSRRYISQHW